MIEESRSISVIIPTTRAGAFLSAAIESVVIALMAAGLSDRAEIVLGDDGWTLTENDLNRMSTKIPVVLARTKNGPKAGPSAARNAAIQISRGKYLFPLDDDDLFLPNRFDVALPLLENNDADAVLETTVRCQYGNQRFGGVLTGPPSDVADPLDMLLSGRVDWGLSQGAISFNRAAFERVGGYNERLRFAEDGEFLCKLASMCCVKLRPGTPVTQYHFHSQNASAPSRVFPWQNVKMLSELYRFLRAQSASKDVLSKVSIALSGKLDYALWAAQDSAVTKEQRKEAVIEAVRAFPFELYSLRNVRSLLSVVRALVLN